MKMQLIKSENYSRKHFQIKPNRKRRKTQNIEFIHEETEYFEVLYNSEFQNKKPSSSNEMSFYTCIEINLNISI